MSITLSEIMKLPALQGARVAAGHTGLDSPVTTISVSEYAQSGQFKDARFDYFEKEVVISAFFACKDNVEKQCETVRGFYDSKLVGLILFYVGVILPRLDERVIELANELNFPIIVMPEDRPDLRYGEVIYEVMEAILKSRLVGRDFKNEVIDQVSRFPEGQQSVGAVLRMLSDKTHSTIVLADAAGAPINASVWPRNLAVESYLQDGVVIDGGNTAELHGEVYHVYSCPVEAARGLPLKTMIYKRGEALRENVVQQMGEAIQTAINLWDRGHGNNVLSELVGAVLKDEPYKIRRIADTFDIPMEDVRDMLIITPLGDEPADNLLRAAPRLISEELAHVYRTAVFDGYDGSMVALMGGQLADTDLAGAAESLCAALAGRGVRATITACRNLADLTQVRKAYLINKETLATAREIYPLRQLFSYSEIKFAAKCKKIVEGGESDVGQQMEILALIPREDGVSYRDMIKTLSTYYLDAESNVTRAGEILYLHKNTIQYRIKKFRERVPGGLEAIPEVDELYTALALNRILEQSGQD